MRTQEEIDNDTAAYVRCRGDSVPSASSCGLVPLSADEYLRQLSRPDAMWCCPHCGSTADFDDEEYERLQDEPS